MDEREIFWAAVQLPGPAARADYLERACSGDDTLRGRVLELLRAHDAGSFLESPAGVLALSEPATGPDTSPLAPTLADVPDSHVGPYRLIRPVGEGGMGTVWLAEHPAPVRRLVALKVIKPGLDSKAVLARFEAERQALALMDHPHIARVFDAGTTAQGRPYFAMELVRGEPIARFCDDRRLGVRERLELFVGVCRAVQHAHQKGVIHRDIKPGNVLVTLQDDRPVPKVIDFGLAKALDRRLTDQTLATEFGALLGTPEYMAPEQADFNRPDIDTRSDVYGLGVLLYELLTGDTPLGRQSARDAGLGELLRRVREEEPARPSARLGSAALASAVRGDLDWIAMRALEKDRDRRYPTADALAEDVARHLRDEPVSARPPGAGYRVRKFVRRHRTAVAAASAFGVVLLLSAAAGTGLTVWALRERDRAAGAEALAKANEGNARESEAEAQAVLAFFQRRVLSAARPKGRDGGLGRDATIRAAVDAAEPEIGRAFAGRPLAEAAVRNALGNTYAYLGTFAAAVRQHERCLALRRERLGPDHPDTLAAMSNLAGAYRGAFRPGDAAAVYREALGHLNAKYGPDHASTLAATTGLAATYQGTGRHAEAARLHEEVLVRARKALGPDDPVTVNVMNDLAIAYLATGRPADAVGLHEQVLKNHRERLGPDHPTTLTVMSGLATAYLAVERPAEAAGLLEDVLRRYREKGSADPIATFIAMGNLAQAYLAAGRPLDAAKYYEDLLKFMGGHAGPDDGHTLELVNNLAVCYVDARRWDRAEELLGQLVERQRASDGDRLRLAASLAQLGACRLEQGKYEPAEPPLREAVTLFQDKEPGAWKTSHARSLLGAALLGQGRPADAEPLLAQGYEGLKGQDARLSPRDRENLRANGERVAGLYEAQGQPEKARVWRDRLLPESSPRTARSPAHVP